MTAVVPGAVPLDHLRISSFRNTVECRAVSSGHISKHSLKSLPLRLLTTITILYFRPYLHTSMTNEHERVQTNEHDPCRSLSVTRNEMQVQTAKWGGLSFSSRSQIFNARSAGTVCHSEETSVRIRSSDKDEKVHGDFLQKSLEHVLIVLTVYCRVQSKLLFK